MESLIVLLVLGWALKAAVTDLPYTVRGQVPPRHAVAMQRLELKQSQLAKRRSPRTRAARNYGGVLWDHAWADMTERHERRRTARKARRARIAAGEPIRRGAARTYFHGLASDAQAGLWRRWDKAWEHASARRRGDEPSLVRQLRDRLNVRSAAAEPQPNSGETEPAAHATAEAATATEKCLECGRPVSHRTFVERGEERLTPALPLCDGHPPSIHRKHAQASTSAGQSSARSTENTNPERNHTMSVINAGEVSGLQSAIDFAEKLAAASEESVQHLETLGAGLSSGGTGQATVGRFGSAGDSLSAAAAQLRDAVSELRGHLTVREAYEATNQQAGDKEFVLAE